MATLKEIAEATGLSVNTVSRVIRGKGYLSVKTRKTVLDAARRLGYVPNTAARELRGRHQVEIAVLAEVDSPDNLCKLAAIREVCSRNHCRVRTGILAEDHPGCSLREIIPSLLDPLPDGLILLLSRRDILQRLQGLNKQFPCVAVTQDPIAGYDCIFPDRASGVYEAMAYLYRQGRRRIAFCDDITSPLSKEGYLAAVKELKLPRILVAGGLKNPVLIRNTGYLNGKMFAAMAQMPDAVIAPDSMAAGLLAGFSAVGLRVPQDIALIGLENKDYAPMLNPPLTALAQPWYEIGSNAAEMLLRRLRDRKAPPQQLKARMALMIRQST